MYHILNICAGAGGNGNGSNMNRKLIYEFFPPPAPGSHANTYRFSLFSTLLLSRRTRPLSPTLHIPRVDNKTKSQNRELHFPAPKMSPIYREVQKDQIANSRVIIANWCISSQIFSAHLTQEFCKNC